MEQILSGTEMLQGGSGKAISVQTNDLLFVTIVTGSEDTLIMNMIWIAVSESGWLLEMISKQECTSF